MLKTIEDLLKEGSQNTGTGVSKDGETGREHCSNTKFISGTTHPPNIPPTSISTLTLTWTAGDGCQRKDEVRRGKRGLEGKRTIFMIQEEKGHIFNLHLDF